MPPPLTRRRALQIGAVAAGSLATTLRAGAAAAGSDRTAAGSLVRLEQSFDQDWRFFRGEATGAEAPTFDDSSWRALDLPHDWSIEDLPYATSTDAASTSYPSTIVTAAGDPTLPTPPPVIGPFDSSAEGGGSMGYMIGGVGWYRKHFSLAELGVAGVGGADPRFELRFDGVYQNADVWLNGVHVGFHPYGYTSFAFDLTPYLDPGGANVLAVRVDNSGRTSRWYSGSGIYRHTWLTVTGAVRIPLWGLSVTTPTVSAQESLVHVEVSVANLGASAVSAQVRLTLLDPQGQSVVTQQAPVQSVDAGATAVSALDIPINPTALWSPASPSLYTARAEVLVGGTIVDTADTRFGVRSLTWNGTTGLVVNGTPVRALGACIHHDNGPMGAVALDRSEERRIQILKEAGFNFIRTAHNPPSPALLDICDRLGMLVMDEFTDIWDTGKNARDYSVYFEDWWQRDLTDMILRDRNHPSVVMWSLGNEISEDSNYAARGAQMAALLRTLDLTRPITLGGGSSTGSGDASWQYVDIGDVHYNANGSGYSSIHTAHPERAMSQSESYPATVYDDYTFDQANPWTVGNWIWAGWDYLGEAGLGKVCTAPPGTENAVDANPFFGGFGVYFGNGGFGYGYPWFQSNCGDIDLIGQRKPQNHWRRAIYGLSPVELLVERPPPPGLEQCKAWWGHYDEQESWNWDTPGQPHTVHVYTPGDSVTLMLDGVPIAVGIPSKCKATFTVPYAAGELTAVASRNSQEIGRKTIATTGAAAALRLTSDVPVLTTGRDDLAHVLVEVIDGQGRLVPDAVLAVSFQVSGAGNLAAVANANPHNLDSFRQPHRYTFHGQALAILRPAKSPGTVTLTASASGLTPATINLPVGQPTAVRVRSFTAHRARGGVAVGWTTASSLDLLGFNLYRNGAKLNRRPIAARGTAAGASYHFLDRHPGKRPARYRLQAVQLDGTREWIASTQVR